MLKRDDQQGTLDLRLVGNYLLTFGSNRIELHYVPPFPDVDGQLTTCDSDFHRLDSNCWDLSFTGASMSEP